MLRSKPEFVDAGEYKKKIRARTTIEKESTIEKRKKIKKKQIESIR